MLPVFAALLPFFVVTAQAESRPPCPPGVLANGRAELVAEDAGTSLAFPPRPGAAPARRTLSMQLKLEKLAHAAKGDPEVMGYLRALHELTQVPEGSKTWLALRFQDPTSNEYKIFNDYLEYLLYRGPKEAFSHAERERIGKVDLALMKVRVHALMDHLMGRLLAIEEPLPEATVKHLQDLLRGGAERIQARADTWFLKESELDAYDIEDLIEPLLKEGISREDAIKLKTTRDGRRRRTREYGSGGLIALEKELASGKEFGPQDLFREIDELNQQDGGTMLGLQPPQRAGSWRIVPGEDGGMVKKSAGSEETASTALVASHAGQIVRPDQTRAIENARSQLPVLRRAGNAIEAHLSTLERGTPEYLEKLDAYHALTGLAIHDSAELWRQGGVLERLMEAAIVSGNQAHRDAATRFILGSGADRIKGNLGIDFGDRNHHSYRDVYLALRNLILSRETWAPGELDFVFAKLNWLETLPAPQDLPGKVADQVVDEILAVRRAEKADPAPLYAAMATPPGEVKRVRYGSYNVGLDVRTSPDEGRILQIHDLDTRLKDDSEFWPMVETMEREAIAQGFDGIEFKMWQNIHQARVFEKRPGMKIKIEKRPVVHKGKIVRVMDEPTFTKSFRFDADPAELRTFLQSGSRSRHVRFGNFTMYLRNLAFPFLHKKKSLTIAQIDADVPGSGFYREAMKRIEALAKENGYDVIVIEWTEHPGQHKLYEELGFFEEKGTSQDPNVRRYYKEIK